jgi:hypothetical protein
MACCISGAAADGTGVEGVAGLICTFSDIAFFSSTSVAPESRPRFWGTLPGSGGVRIGIADLRPS